ncbi:MAG: transposase family protein [Psychrobacillus sp.]
MCTHRHSHTNRKIRDLPILGKEGFLHIRLQKWFCRNPQCGTTIFTETFDAAPDYERKTVPAYMN